MNRIARTLRRLDPRRSQTFSALSPTVQITWADIMHDLDPNWIEGGWTADPKGAESR